MKYKNKPQEWQGQKFRSKRELERYQVLLMMEKSGLIKYLRREVVHVIALPVVLDGRKKPALRYIADFVYWDDVANRLVVEDCKGMRTPVYRIKRHLMKSELGIEVVET